MKLLISVLASGICAGLVSSANAQGAPSSLGTVEVLSESDTSVLVLRGGEAFRLSSGDPLFQGDTVFTRSDGAATLTLNGCSVELGAAAKMAIGAESCLQSPIQLADTDVVGGYPIAADSGGIGATPAILAGLAGAGGAAAAAGSDSGSTSP